MSNFEFNAPQFRVLEEYEDNDGADIFFDVESDDPPLITGDDNNKENTDNMLVSPKPIGSEKKQQGGEKPRPTNMKRRSMLKAVRRLSVGQPSSGVTEKISKELNKLSVQTENSEMINLRNRAVNKETPKSVGKKRKTIVHEDDQTHQKKYLALAEEVLRFERATPPRFRTQVPRNSGSRKSMLKARQSYNPRRTIALTPNLMTKLRARPVDIPSIEKREEMELEEMKKQQVKANPLNKKVFKTPKLPKKQEKHITVQEPFKFINSYVKVEVPKPAEEPFKFTAKPVPKKILERPVGLRPKAELPITVPQSPAITKSTRHQGPVRVATVNNDNEKTTENLRSFGVPYCKQGNKTLVKPFSFENRDKELFEKKEKKIKEVIEAEKKAREFKANPVPSFLSSREAKHSHVDCSMISTTSSMAEEHQPFRARSPRVLRKVPFKPKLEHAQIQPMDVQLRTERRAEEREEFEFKQRENEMLLETQKQLMEMRKKDKEEEELAKLRKELVHKAKPMPVFKEPPKKPASNIPLTNPMSPRFSKRIRSHNHSTCASSK